VEAAAPPVAAELVAGELKITKDQLSVAQRGLFYFGGLQAPADPQAPLMLEFTLRMNAADIGPGGSSTGVATGILNNDSGVIIGFTDSVPKRVYLLDPSDAAGVVANTPYDWDQGVAHTFKLLWHPQLDLVNLYVSVGQQSLQSDVLLISTTVSAFAQTPVDERRESQPWAFFGHKANNRTSISYWSEVSLCNIVNTPLMNGITRDAFGGHFKSDDIVHYRVDDLPHKVGHGWLPLPAPFVEPPRKQVSIEDGALAMDRRPDTGSFGFYRQEMKVSNGVTILDFRVSGDLRSIPVDTQATGMNLFIDDGVKLVRVAMLSENGTQYFGVASSATSLELLSSYAAALQSWSVDRHYRLMLDQTSLRLSIIVADDDGGFVESPFATMAYADLPASTLPTGLGFLHDGTNDPISAVMRLTMLRYQVDVRNYEASVLPAVPWVQIGAGGVVTNGILGIEETTEAANGYFYPETTLDPEQGCTAEVRCRVDSYEVGGVENPVREVTGVGFSIDDGSFSTKLLFADAGPELGKIAFLSKSADPTADLLAIRSGESLDNYVQVDWTSFHNYRLEKTKGGSLALFIDEGESPSLEFPETDFPYPSSGTQGIYFGHLVAGRNSTSSWHYVRHSVSAGFDVSFQAQLSENEVLSRFNHVVNVIVEAEDV
jgi:hypothetical protein